jgi:hypothetical protein
MGDTTAEPAEWIETGAHARFKEEAGQVSLEITFGDTQYGLTAPAKSPREQGSLERLWCDGRPLFTLRARNREANP